MKRKLAAAALTALVGGGALVGLAPGAGADPMGFAAFDWDDWCGTKVPIKLPPPPDPWPFGGLVLDHTQVVSPVVVDVGLGEAATGQLDLGAAGIGEVGAPGL